MTISKVSRLCATNTRDDINSTVRELNARIDSHYYQAFGHGYAFPQVAGSPAGQVALAHGVPTQVPNPLRGGVAPFSVLALNCDTQAIPTLQIGATVGGYTTVTALYPLAEQYASITQSTTQLLSGSGATLISFPAALDLALGQNIAWDGSTRMTAQKKGLYEVWYQATFGSEPNGLRAAWVSINGAGDYALLDVTANQYTGETTNLASSDLLYLNAGDYVQLRQYAHGQAVNINTVVNATYACRLRMRQLSNDASLTANVTLAFIAP